jgi:hypothetical protein
MTETLSNTNDDELILKIFNRDDLNRLGNDIFYEIKPLIIKLYYYKWKEYKLKTVSEIAAMLLLENDQVSKEQISYYDRYMELYGTDPDMMAKITQKIDTLTNFISKSQRGRPSKEAQFHYDFNKNKK